jgi:urease accessory protein
MPSLSKLLKLGLGIAASLIPTAAFAHPGFGAPQGFGNGFAHPLSGIDHILAMTAVGMFAANLGGRALWAAPCSFMAAMAAGGVLGMSGVPIPYVEAAIGLSVIVFGLAVALRLQWPVAAAMALAGFFAIFHGHAHGTEMVLGASGEAYAAGFVAATGLLHLIGIGIGAGINRLEPVYAKRTAQVSGTAMTIAGAGLLAGLV